MKRHFAGIVADAQDRIQGLLDLQCLDTDSPDYGAVLTYERGYSEPGQSTGAIDSLMSVYLCPRAKRQGDAALLRSAELYADHLLRAQHDDGTMDLRETNFHDATMIGFSTQTLAYTLQLLEANVATCPEIGELAQKVETFLRRGVEGMLTGGFHTPNHRWVLASALTLMWHQFDDERCRQEAELYLAEGIDCTDLGEYTERSTGIYNVVNNRSLLIMADLYDRPELAEPVARNLHMVLNYLEPGGTLFTGASRRQDRGGTSYPISYYSNYLAMAHRTGEPMYAGVADMIADQVKQGRRSGDGLGSMLTQYLLREDWRENDVAGTPPSRSYEFHNPSSGVVRLRHEEFSVTLNGQDTRFLHVRAGELAITARIASTFYGDRGRFTPQSLEKEGETWTLAEHKRWGFKRPFPEPSPTSDWDQMPHEQREEVQMRDLDFTVGVRWLPTEQAIEVHLQTTGLEGVLYKLELLLSADGQLETDVLRLPCAAGQSAVLCDGDAVYRCGRDAIRIGGGFGVHNSTAAMRGSEAPDTSAFTLYFTAVTPVDRVVRIERLQR